MVLTPVNIRAARKEQCSHLHHAICSANVTWSHVSINYYNTIKVISDHGQFTLLFFIHELDWGHTVV